MDTSPNNTLPANIDEESETTIWRCPFGCMICAEPNQVGEDKYEDPDPESCDNCVNCDKEREHDKNNNPGEYDESGNKINVPDWFGGSASEYSNWQDSNDRN